MKVLIGIVAVAVVLGVGGFIVMNKDDSESSQSTNSPSQSQQTENMPDMNTSSTEQSTADGSAAKETSNIVMSNLAFSPSKITVKKGTTVTWTNNDDVQHDINPDEPTQEFKKSALFGKGGTYSVKFDTAGTYSYHCTPHPFMKGTIEVTE